jgi:subtilisin family serine protease
MAQHEREEQRRRGVLLLNEIMESTACTDRTHLVGLLDGRVAGGLPGTLATYSCLSSRELASANQDQYSVHATDCAATIRSVAPNSGIYSIEVLPSRAAGSVQALCRGIYLAVELGVDTISISAATVDESSRQALSTACRYATARGIVVAGASYRNSSSEGLPAVLSECLGVGLSSRSTSNPLILCDLGPVNVFVRPDAVRIAAPNYGRRVLGASTSLAVAIVAGLLARLGVRAMQHDDPITTAINALRIPRLLANRENDGPSQ